MLKAYLICVAGAVGLVIGSFLNVVIARLPEMARRRRLTQANCLLGLQSLALPQFNLFFPRSHCPRCKSQIRVRDLIPVVSWIALGGKCASCSSPIPIRYLFVELATFALFVLAAWSNGVSMATAMLVCGVCLLIVIAAIYWERRIVPEELSYLLLFLGLFVSAFLPRESLIASSLESAVVGAIAGYISLWLLDHGLRWIGGTNENGGDMSKLHAAIGAWVGWEVLPLILASACVIAAVLYCSNESFAMIRGRALPAQQVLFGLVLACVAIASIFLALVI